MSIKGQQLRLHYEDFTIYIITLNRTPQPQECLSRDSNCVYTTRTSPSIYSNFKLDTTTTGMSIKGQQLRLHYEDFTTIYSNFKLDTTTTGMSIKGQQLRLHYEDFTTFTTTTGMSIKGQQLYEDYHLYNIWPPIFKQDTTTTGMSIKGQQLRLHYEDFTIYI